MDITSTPINNLEKPMTLRWCLTYMSALLFADVYMLIRFDNNLAGINLKWVKDNIDLNESFLIVLTFSLTYAVLIPGVGFLGRFILGPLIFKIRYDWLDNKILPLKFDHLTKNDYENFIRIEELKYFGIKNNNYSAYQAYLEKESSLESNAFIRFICQSIVTLVIIGWIYSSKTNPSLSVVFEMWFTNSIWYYQMVISFALLGLGFYVFILAFEEHGKYHRYVFLPKHEIK